MKTVSATEARNRFGALIGDVADGTGAVVIERFGRPHVVIVSFEEWVEVSEMRERMLRQEAWQEIWELTAEAGARIADLSQEEADAIADELADEAKRRVASRLRRS